MLGRHTLDRLDPVSLACAVSRSGLAMSREEAGTILSAAEGYAEPFYRWLGAEVVESFDYSDYEQATHCWNMNEALPSKFRDQYDFVFDGGTLEHVFRYSDALREALTLPRQGGVFLSATPANSYLGHGFYQFSPDLPFSTLQPENGYQLGAVHLVELRRRAVFYEVLPPGEVRGRALASPPWPTLMYFWGQRTGEIPEKLGVLQPDYEATWKGAAHQERGVGAGPSLLARLASGLPHDLRNDLLRLAKLGYTTLRGNAFFDRKCFNADKTI